MERNLIKSENDQQIVKFDYSQEAKPFVLKSLSEEIRRTNETHIKEFFHFHNLKHPVNVTATDVIRWRKERQPSGDGNNQTFNRAVIL